MNVPTPGPWRTGDMFGTVFGPPNGTPCPDVIATVHKNNKANARLIAAAPELLTTAKDALESLKRLTDVHGAYRVTCMTQLENAIAKAERP